MNMIIFNLKAIMLKKSAQSGKKITLKTISKSTGIEYTTLSRIASTPNYNINIDHIEKLCNYFNCTPNDLMSIYPDENPQ
jgi:putative transcriptional regulator